MTDTANEQTPRPVVPWHRRVEWPALIAFVLFFGFWAMLWAWFAVAMVVYIVFGERIPKPPPEIVGPWALAMFVSWIVIGFTDR